MAKGKVNGTKRVMAYYRRAERAYSCTSAHLPVKVIRL